MANNIGKLFYKDYYKGINFLDVIGEKKEVKISDINNRIRQSLLVQIDSPIKEKDGLQSFKLKVQYPGLITGVGLVHDSKDIEGGYNLGMHFDYTMGMPIIYGSSVKGVLSSYFKTFCEEEEAKLDDLYNQIFEGKKGDKNISIYERDVFFDAVIVNPKTGFLEDDSITPHTGGPLKNPIPITMLKIAPGTTIEFRFRLKDSDDYTVDSKLKIFKEILTTVGIGAKTNVGYGQLTSID